ncbi:MAG: 3'(2'),5'-bisphosphate nucleotidase CysQ [Gammaproteobacteria bacterium]|nr:3'(2'),5'-bisphosphate nucleotidase CysQ [Gammaproteobacteria bacterium]
MTTDRTALLDQVISLAISAGEKILAVYATDFRVHHKHDHSPVTEADRLSDEVIVAGLKLLTPGIPTLSEETEAPLFNVRAPWKTLWLVDPLDGTREFVKRNGEFTVNIALIEDGDPVLGVVYAPMTSTCYYGTRGHGAFKKVGSAAPVAIHAKRYQPDAQMIVTGSRSHNTGDELRRLLTQIGPHKYLPMGSALKSCLVAEGKADIYPRFGPTCEWDTAAAQCIVEEAGGQFTDMQLQPLRYNVRDTLLNPHFLVFGDPNYDWRRLLA